MAEDNKRIIRIESILGGHAPTTHFAASNQFRSSLGIDPGLPYEDDFTANGSGNTNAMGSSGLLRPVSCKTVTGGSTSASMGIPLWIKDQPKTTTSGYFMYDQQGSAYAINFSTLAVTDLGDLNDGGTAGGNGMEYYDNYMYFARSTTIARYGPLNYGGATWTDDYWVTTLSKTALTNTFYHYDALSSISYPNHVLHRHSDGRLYIADVVDGKGTIHYIQTTKTGNEGDTDNGSTYNKLQVGYGLLPVAMESYGSDLAIAFVEGDDDGLLMRAKVAFWDTTSQNVNKITWVEFPDTLITALKNINGVLYVISGEYLRGGFRISRFVGGYTFEEVWMSENGIPCFPGAIDGDGKRLLFGSYTNTPEFAASVYSLGLKKSSLSNGIFSIYRHTEDDESITALKAIRAQQPTDMFSIIQNDLLVGSGSGANDGTVSASEPGNSADGYQYAPSVWWSQIYRIGQPFKITAIKIPLATPISTNHTITAKVYLDNNKQFSPYTLTTINNTNFSGKQRVVLRNDNAGDAILGQNHFWIELKWTGAALMTVELPITIEYELIDD